ncbi:hypothetical protein Taro_004828 [Colocasia esculenta]|uniref:X8 domain-containing protein n=1 Tax=Colocasia esculenta TaxID=4460 RepID=A0A843TJ85_COLES|nr:hypothetical protein [Colocasia esculenta]
MNPPFAPIRGPFDELAVHNGWTRGMAQLCNAAITENVLPRKLSTSVLMLWLYRERGMGGGIDSKAAVAAVLLTAAMMAAVAEGGSWCIARSGASQTALQTALDYACGAGADCTPIQASGFCYLPNTLQAHASYAFNSYYQRNNMSPGSCDFAGTATVTITDPSQSSVLGPPLALSLPNLPSHTRVRCSCGEHISRR